jgi:glutamate 5-kinase
MRDFNKVKRIVVKIGTNTLTREGQLDSPYVRTIAQQISHLLRQGKQVVLISSGAIGMGAAQLQLAQSPKEMKMRQACAAIGQPLLMTQYRKAFQRYNTAVGQVLLTAEVLDHRETYLNLRNAIETLLKLGVVPILNENDSVSTAEIGTAFGDNDRLSALVASKMDADLLIILSDIDALYDRNPRLHEDAKPIDTVLEITDEIRRSAGDKGSRFSTGGMRTKLEAATIAANAGYRIVLAHGRTKNVIERIMSGESIGTVFMPKRRLSNRARWILNSQTAGTICIDEGAEKALQKRKSLLPSGIIRIKGSFESGAVVLINDMAKAVTSLSSTQLATLVGKHSTEIKTLYGTQHRDVVATPEDIVLIQG